MAVTPINLNNHTFLVQNITHHITNDRMQTWTLTCTNGFKFRYMLQHTQNIQHTHDFRHESAEMLNPKLKQLDLTQTQALRTFIIRHYN